MEELMQASAYRAEGRNLLSQATLELAAGDTRQASEKGWGAAAQMVKAVAHQQGWRHSSHAMLYQAVDQLVEMTGDPEIFDLFGIAGHLHVNFYENWATNANVERGLHSIQLLLDKLEPLLR
jgi:hypothetical protein